MARTALLLAVVAAIAGEAVAATRPMSRVATNRLSAARPAGPLAVRMGARGEEDGRGPRVPSLSARAGGLVAAAALVASLAGPAGALDSLKVGECLLQRCTADLARCISDPKCAANVVCLNLCNGKKDESACEVRCGDQFDNPVVQRFNTCAVSNKKCVPQEKDEGKYPLPPAGATIDTFDTRDFTGVWYITAGQNPLFDTFPCQKHVFSSSEAGKLKGDLYWRVKTPYGAEMERTAVQEFVADPEHAGILYNHDNEFLHYQDDWYIIGYKPNEYALIYYRGTNDAWDGYGGAVLYTKAKSLPEKYIPELEDACKKVPGLRWADFQVTDNSCRKIEQFPLESEIERDASILRLDLEKLENDVEIGLYGIPTEINAIETDLQRDIRVIEKAIEKEEKEIQDDLGKFFGGLFGKK